MDLFGIGPMKTLTGLLVFVRVLGIFTAAPVLGHVRVPAQVKVGIAAMITLVVTPLVAAPAPETATHILLFAVAVMKEAAVGLTLGFVAMMAFVAIQLAGEASDMQIGFGLANVADPLLGTRTSLLGQFQYTVATLLFLVLNGHHFLVAALVKSFSLVPVGALEYHPDMTGSILKILAGLFMLGLSIGAPVMLAVFLTDLALGLLGRTVPQMNLLLVGFPVKIAVGVSMLLVSLPFFVTACRGLFDSMYRDLFLILDAMV